MNTVRLRATAWNTDGWSSGTLSPEASVRSMPSPAPFQPRHHGSRTMKKTTRRKNRRHNPSAASTTSSRVCASSSRSSAAPLSRGRAAAAAAFRCVSVKRHFSSTP